VFPNLIEVMGEILMPYEKLTQLQSQLIIGTKQTVKAINNGEVSEVFIAKDADQHIIDKVMNSINKFNIPYTFVDSKKKLGKACKIEVGASTVAIKQLQKG